MMVRVAGHITIRSASDFAGFLAEGIPDGGTATIFINRAFDLVAVEHKSLVCKLQ
jgi:hypothetical protein